MPKCPKCGEQIDFLNCYSHEQVKRAVSLDNDGRLDWSGADTFAETSIKDEFECPECAEVLFVTEGTHGGACDKVIPFLKSE